MNRDKIVLCHFSFKTWILYFLFGGSRYQLKMDRIILLLKYFRYSVNHYPINQSPKKGERKAKGRKSLAIKIFVLFSGNTSINRENTRFISHHFIFIASQQTKKYTIYTLLNKGLFTTFDVIEIHMTSRYIFSVDFKNHHTFF